MSDPIAVEDPEQAPARRRVKLPGTKPPETKPPPKQKEKKKPEAEAQGDPEAIKNVPTTLEGLMTLDGDQKSPHQVLGILVEADIKEADAILGRTFLSDKDVITVNNALDIARNGMGGSFYKPMPFVSKWVLSILRTLPSVGGRSRQEFIKAWNTDMENRRYEKEAARRRQELSGS